MIAIGYARISKKGDPSSVSIELQNGQIALYCKRQGFNLAHIVEHDGVSGQKRKRFAIVDDAIKQHGAKVVVYYVQDRMARDVALGDWFKTLVKRGIEVHEAAGRGKLDIKSADGRMVINIMASVDACYAEKIGEKTTAALKHLRNNARRYSNIRPLGYDFEYEFTDCNGKKHYKLIEDQEEQRGLVILTECAKVGLGARRALQILIKRNYTGRQSLKAIHQALVRIKTGATIRRNDDDVQNMQIAS